MHFDPSLPHRWFASGGKPAVVVVAAILPDRVQTDLANRIARSIDDRVEHYCMNVEA